MKQLSISLLVLFLVACNDNNKTATDHSDSTATTTASTTNYEYSYTLEKPYSNWQSGDQQHVVNVQKSLKAYENNNIPETVKYFADTVDLHFDNLDARISRDSLATLLTGSRARFSNVLVKMDDWESVISKDKKDEWVTIWYKEITTDKSGKIDSLAVINDAKIVNGKIAVLNEAIRHFGKK